MSLPRLMIVLSVAVSACGAEQAAEPAAPPAPAAPKVDIEAMRLKAAQEIAAEKAKKRDELRAAGTGTLTKKKKVGDKLELEFAFDNKTDKVLMRAEGTLEIKDEAGTMIKNLKMTFGQEIKGGKTGKKKGRFPIKPEDTDDAAFAKAKLAKLQIEWMPRHYRYKDGTTMMAD